MIEVSLLWHNASDDLTVGIACLDVLPPVGSTLLFAADTAIDGVEGVIWRVAKVVIYPAQQGSMAWRQARAGDRVQVAQYTAFVEPTEGPFHWPPIDGGTWGPRRENHLPNRENHLPNLGA